MTTSKRLPDRPSLESFRKQPKKLVRDIADGDHTAIARARAQLPDGGLPLTQRNAQLVLAGEYGYAGWQDLTAEVSKRLGHGLEWAATQARRVIHDNDIERLKQLLAEYPRLLLLRRQPPLRSQALKFAVTYARPHLIPVLTRIWPLPDDWPHAAAVGNLSRVKQWFEESGAPALGISRITFLHPPASADGSR